MAPNMLREAGDIPLAAHCRRLTIAGFVRRQQALTAAELKVSISPAAFLKDSFTLLSVERQAICAF